MTSKRLFVNLLKENSKRRLWPTALSIAGNFFAQIVYTMIAMGHYADRLEEGRTTLVDINAAFFRNHGGIMNVPVLIIVVGMAALFALQGYSYLFNSRETDLYYSLPVKRNKIFSSFNLLGILIFVIPYIICHIITVMMGLSRGYVLSKNIPLFAASALVIILEYILCYEVCVLAAILTGHVVVAILGCGVFFLFGLVVEIIQESMMCTFFSSYCYGSAGGLMHRLSPIGLILDITSGLLGPDNRLVVMNFGTAMPVIIMAIVAAIGCFVLGLILIEKRPAEAAGKAMAFDITKPVIKVAILVVSGISAGMIFYSISNTPKCGMIVFGMICGLIFVHFVIETIYEFDFKASFGHFGSLAVSAVISAFILIACVFDIFGYETWQPMPNKVESVAFADDLGYSNTNYPLNLTYIDTYDTYGATKDSVEYAFDKMKLTDMESVEKLTRQGAINAAENHKRAIHNNDAFFGGYEESYGNAEDIGDDSSYYSTSVNVKWRMKNGKEIKRRYYIDLTEGELLDAYKNIYASKEYKLGKLPVLTEDLSEIRGISCETIGGNFYEKVDGEMVKGLIDAYKEDVLSQTFDDAQKENPDSEIGFSYEGEGYGDYSMYNLFVYPSFKKTAEYLSAREIPLSWKDGEDKIGKATIGTIIYGDDEVTEDYWTTNDSDDILKVVKCTMPYNLYSASLNSSLVSSEYRNSLDHAVNTSFSVDVDGNRGTETFDVVVMFDNSLPEKVKTMCFPEVKTTEDSAANSGSAGWTTLVLNRR